MSNFIDYLESNVGYRYVSGGSQLQIDECPFCGRSGRDSSVYVGVFSQAGFCHHCEVGFSGISYVMEREGIPYKKAKAILDDDDDYAATPKDVAAPFEVPFPDTVPISMSDDAQDYLEGRNITKEMITHFSLQYCIRNLDITFPNGEQRQYKTKYRIVIPIFDLEGNIISWQARDTTGRAKNKYLFPPEFRSAEYLYNAVNIPDNPNYLIISEGLFDVFGWWRAGFKNVVATFGKKISSFQIDLVKKINPKVIFIAWDADALIKKYEFCEKYNYLFSDIRILELPGNLDSDECDFDTLMSAFKSAYHYDWTKKILRLI